MTPDFTCLRCGNCCRHSGEVRLKGGEAEIIAGALGLGVEAFTHRFTRLNAERRGLALVEHPDGTCIFLENSPCACRIQQVKPAQCRTFPMDWRYADLEKVCPASRYGARGGPE